MKKLFITLAAVLAFAACSDDEPAAWEKLPTAPISGENATLTVNGSTMGGGSAQLTATSATQGTLLLTKVLPGYDEITMDVDLAERADGTGTFDITGETELTTPPAMLTKAADELVIYNVSVRGYITPDGKTEVTLTSALSTEAQGELTGSWDLLTKLTVDADSGSLLTAPLWVTWSAQDPEQPNAQQAAMAVRQFGSSLLYQFLHSVTFSNDGNITAEYWDGEGFDMQKDMATYLFSGLGGENEAGEPIMSIIRENPQWSKSPKNLAYWYVKGEYLYVVPNITAILAQIGKDTGSNVSGGLDDIKNLLAGLGAYGIDGNALMQLVTQWMGTGIPLKYEIRESEKSENEKPEIGLKLYADKEMCRPVIEALLPALPKLDEALAKLVAETPEDDPNYDMIQYLPMMVYSMLGVENFAALDSIWKNNTNEFEISLNFVNKPQ